MHSAIKAFLLALVATPFLYGLGAAAIEASGYRAGYGEGRVLLVLSFFAAFTAGQFFFRAPKISHTEQKSQSKQSKQSNNQRGQARIEFAQS